MNCLLYTSFQERDFVYVHTPLITGSDCEGAGEMFQVTTLDLDNLPRTEDGKIDYSKMCIRDRASFAPTVRPTRFACEPFFRQ